MAYSPEERTSIIDEICDKITEGSTLRKALDESKISYRTYFQWLDADEEKVKQYARATELRAEAMADELLSIADNQEDDVIEIDGKEVVNHNVIQRARLRVDSRKWLMSKMNPKKYSERVLSDVTLRQEQPLFGDD